MKDQFEAFRTGFRDARRYVRAGYTPRPEAMSYSDAMTVRPSVSDHPAAYLNGLTDGAANDTFRLSLINEPRA